MAGTSGALGFGVELHLAKEDVADLLGGVKVEFFAGVFEDAAAELIGHDGELSANLLQRLIIETNAGVLHLDQN